MLVLAERAERAMAPPAKRGTTNTLSYSVQVALAVVDVARCAGESSGLHFRREAYCNRQDASAHAIDIRNNETLFSE